MRQQKKLIKIFILFLVSLAFYLVWYLLDGIILTEDAPSYIHMQSDRVPGYCLYLWLFRTVFGMPPWWCSAWLRRWQHVL